MRTKEGHRQTIHISTKNQACKGASWGLSDFLRSGSGMCYRNKQEEGRRRTRNSDFPFPNVFRCFTVAKREPKPALAKNPFSGRAAIPTCVHGGKRGG